MAIVRYTTEQLKKLKDKTDWTRVLSMTDDDIDYSDAPDIVDMLERGEARLVGRPKKAVTKKSLTLRVDPDIVSAYKKTGRGWQTRINDALRAHLHSIGLL
jgi:uncharacterized protein (DUF4415 family)